jgi:ubiquinone/menaquinone biosynthesis C-methylase UbiE
MHEEVATMSEVDRGQVSTSAAEVYEEFFLPAIFQQFAPAVCDAALVGEGQRVLDVACGTGVVAREAQARVGPAGSVVGLDVNDGMLAVARRVAPTVEWRQGRAEALPFEDGAFDAALCQYGLMFFEDRVRALEEMARVTRPGGRTVAAVWAALPETPGYLAMVGLLERLFGASVAALLRSPFELGDGAVLEQLARDAGWKEPEILPRAGTARFPSIADWVHTDIRGWTLADVLDDDQFDQLQTAAAVELRPFTDEAGAVAFPAPALLLTATAG